MLRNNLVLTNAVADSVRKKISTAFKLGKRLVCVLLFKTVISITSLSDIRMYFETVINIREKNCCFSNHHSLQVVLSNAEC